MNNLKKINSYLLLTAIFSFTIILFSCTPDRDDEFSLNGQPNPPDFTVEPISGNPNKFVLKNLSNDNFQVLWDLPGGTPKTSSKSIDTVLYNKAGIYKITLFVSKTNGSGTGISKKTINIEMDAPLTCGPKLALLTGDCLPAGKCWTMSTAAGAVKVGPTYDDYSWYTSPANGLQAAQYDDRFCFTFENLVFRNNNNGASVNPWDGYKVQSVDFGVSDFNYLEGTGINNRDQIVMQNNQFIGVWDSDNILDVVTLTKTKLVLRGRQRAPDGTPLSEGWFELTLISQ